MAELLKRVGGCGKPQSDSLDAIPDVSPSRGKSACELESGSGGDSGEASPPSSPGSAEESDYDSDFSEFKENYACGVHESEKTKHPVKPSQVHDVHFIHLTLLGTDFSKLIGKWMVFKHHDEMDKTWENIRSAIINDDLHGCRHATVSTMRYNPSQGGPGPNMAGVICVYTAEHDMDAIGFKLSEMVEQDIKYKTERATNNGEYSFIGSGRVSLKTIYWNNGQPSFQCTDRPCHGTSFRREDLWRLNVVEAPESLNLGAVHGRWVLFLEYRELTGLWHFLKRIVESEKANFGVIRMVCPPKRVRNCPSEPPEFHLHTNSSKKKIVGMRLAEIVERDIVYQHKPRGYSSRPPRDEVLYWNDGEPDFERVIRKGITKNWRTGEDVM